MEHSEEDLERVDSFSDLASTSSSISSILAEELPNATSSSSDFSASTSSSGEILPALMAETILPSSDASAGEGGSTETRSKCVGKNSRVAWGTDLASSNSSISSILTEELPSVTSSSSDVSASTRSSGEILPALLAEFVLPSSDASAGEGGSTATRSKCVGKNSRVAWGTASVIGRRKEMEDALAVVPGFMRRACDHVGGCAAPGSRTSGEISPVHFFGVYDGHGGSQVAKFCSERMHDVIREEWDRETVSESEWHKRWEQTFFTGFETTDKEVLMESVAPKMVGSTAVVVVLSGCQIIASHCGDSRAVLCRGNKTIPLTIDQKPDREDELMRIEREDGKVINWNGARVFGVLTMSRAIGDHYLRPWIIPVPETTFMTRSDEDECLILASDGLWDVMTNEEVGEFARRLLRRRRRSMVADETSPAQAVADSLTEIAVARNSSDNISIIVVDLKSKRRHQQRQCS